MIKSPVFEKQKIELEKEELARKILINAGNELSLKMRYFALAVGSLGLVPDASGPTGTDGAVIEYCPEEILELYLKGRNYVIHLYLHMICHCLFGHPFNMKNRGTELWDLACDVASESLVDSLKLKCARLPAGAFRKSVYARLEAALPAMNAEGIYEALRGMELGGEELGRWQAEFACDSHRLWERHGRDNERIANQNQNRKRWEEIRERMQTEIALFSREAADKEGDLLERLDASGGSKYDYREFLRKFMVLREEMQVDPDSFDYIFYNYGMELYGNMPLIEPLETREVHGVEELVIVIDTSMSCKGELVRAFLEETFHILGEEESFFGRFRIHVLQCDEKVQSDVVIHSTAEEAEYMKHFAVKGGGGTDFRPAFAYVEEMLAAKQFRQLRGLLYFTDGYGTFPVKMPPYETAFIFLKDRYRDVDVPPWAIRCVLDEGTLRETGALKEL